MTRFKSLTVLLVLSAVCVEGPQAQGTEADWNRDSLLQVDYESLVSRADLSYNEPATRSEEGMPVGNGRTGSLVWTTPAAMHFQINRVDVFAMGRNSNCFPRGDDAYASSCGYVDIRMVDYGEDVFTGAAFNQHLSVYEGLSTVKGNGVNARVLAWNDGDVIATEIDDQRVNPTTINIDLRMLRYVMGWVRGENRNLTRQHATQIRRESHVDPHTATSRLDLRDGRILLIQEYREGDYYNASAVAIGIAGRKSKAAYANETTVRLSAEPGPGTFMIFTASASSFDPKEDVAELAIEQLEAAQQRGFDGMLEDNQDWWSHFWSKSLIRMHSVDGEADYVEKNHTYFLYIMASCSRGDYMPGFRGMLWHTTGDLCMWGSQYWWNNLGFYYNGLTPANHPELLAPVFSTHSRHYDSYARAAKQQWGSQGVWIPETNWFNGLEELPENIAFARKDDIQDIVYLSERRERYLYLAKQFDYQIIDGSKSQEKILEETLGILASYGIIK